jgi:sRNA-binding regulator protein Hfq
MSTPTGRHEASRESAFKLISYLKEEFKERRVKRLKVTLALKDGREVIGLMRKYDGYKGPRYLLMAPDDPVRKITVFKHAVDDF